MQFIRENPDIVRAAIKNKNKEEVDLDRVLALGDERRKLAGDITEINRQRNEAQAARDGEAGKRLKDELRAAEERYQEVEKELVSLLVKIPNIPSADTPVGPDESGNQVVRQWGDKPQFNFVPKAHWDLGRDLGLIDNEKASEVSGARFTYLKGDLALMQFALVQLAMSVVTSRETLKSIIEKAGLTVSDKPFIPVVPPVMMRPQVMNRMARLEPREERYVFDEDTVLVGSAEHTLGPLHMDEVITEDRLPIRYAGYSTAFRREAGAAGKDTRGILRQHQFDKVEMESFSLPEDGYAEQELFVAIQEHLMQLLKLPYQVIIVCTGDMGGPDQRQFDIETWMPGQTASNSSELGCYRETQTSDYMGGYQARRLNARIKRADGTVEPVHMNDATAYAIGRTLIAIMENYQQADGSIAVPEALRPFMGGRERLEKVTI